MGILKRLFGGKRNNDSNDIAPNEISIKEPNVDELMALLSNPDHDWEVIVEAADELVKLGDARAVEPLIAELNKDRSWEKKDQLILEYSAFVLGELKDGRAVEALYNLMDDLWSHFDNSVLRQAVKALHKLDNAGIPIGESTKHMVKRALFKFDEKDVEKEEFYQQRGGTKREEVHSVNLNQLRNQWVNKIRQLNAVLKSEYSSFYVAYDPMYDCDSPEAAADCISKHFHKHDEHILKKPNAILLTNYEQYKGLAAFRLDLHCPEHGTTPGLMNFEDGLRVIKVNLGPSVRYAVNWVT